MDLTNSNNTAAGSNSNSSRSLSVSSAMVDGERRAFQDAVQHAKDTRQVEAVIEVMEKFADSAYIQKVGCDVLQGQFLQVSQCLIVFLKHEKECRKTILCL